MLMHKLYVPVEADLILSHRISAILCDNFGGFTKYNCEGAWSPYKNKLVLEPTKTYEVVTDKEKSSLVFEDIVNLIINNTEEEEVMYVTLDATPVVRKRK